MNKKISIVIPTLNKEKDLIACIDSIKNFNTNKYKLEIIVVDDKSKDQKYNLLRKKHKDVKLILHKQNLGFAKSVNDGIKASTGNIIILLNDDTIVTYNWIDGLIEQLKKNEVGIVTGKILYLEPKDKRIIWYAGGKYTPLLPRVSWHRGYNEIDKGNYDKLEETEFISGCLMAFRKDFIERIGLFDEKFFLYFEDVDFCLRAKKAGYKLIYNPKVTIYHAVSKTTQKESEFWFYHREKSRIIFIKKHYPYLLGLFILYHLIFYFPQAIVFSLVKRKNLMKGSFFGFLDGLFQN